MRLIIQEHRAAGAVALHLWVGVGGRDEGPAERGFSHLAEHMLFKGTATRGRGFVEQEVEAVGGRSNAGTSHDYTFYWLLLPAARVTQGLELLADMAFKATFDPAEIEREREVVFEEMRFAEDSPRTSLFRRLFDLAFGGHPYGSPVLGDAAALKAASRATLRGYYERHYVPENMSLVVVGPVDAAEVRAAAMGAFGSVSARGYRRVNPPEAVPLDGVKPREIERPERQGALGLGWSAPPLGHSDIYAVDLLARILGGSRTSRLNQALRERSRLVSSVSAGYHALAAGGLLSVTAHFEPADQARVEAAIFEEIRLIQDAGVSPEELALALTASEAERAFSRETVEGLARAYGHAETVWSLEAERRYLERLRRVTRGEIAAAARRYLIGSYARLAFVPKGQDR